MSEVALRQFRNAELAVPADDAYDRLARWAQAATAAHQVAEQLVQTSFVPVAYRNKPHEATAAILAGSEVGLSPMASLRAFDNIQGTTAPKAITLRAIVQSRGHRMWEVDSSATVAVVRGQRKGEQEVHESKWTIERAKGMGLTTKDNWKNQPTAMLMARATAECARLTAADAILGMPYSAEEIADGTVDGEVVQQQPKVTVAEILGEPAPTSETTPAEREVLTRLTRLITQAQQRRLHALLKENDLADRAAGLSYISKLLDREVESTKELTAEEASLVIDSLAQPPGDEEPALDLDGAQ